MQVPVQLLPSFNKGLSKKEITSLVAQSVARIAEEGNALEIAELLSVMDEFISQYRKDAVFIDCVRYELDKYSGKFQSVSGTKIEPFEAATRYDFSSDGSWRHVAEKIDQLNAERKSIEERLKRIPPGKTIIDEETGELLQGPSKTSVSTYKISLPKT